MAKIKKSQRNTKQLLVTSAIVIALFIGLLLWLGVQPAIPLTVNREVVGNSVTGVSGPSATQENEMASGGTGNVGAYDQNLDTVSADIDIKLNQLDSSSDSIDQSLNETPADLSE